MVLAAAIPVSMTLAGLCGLLRVALATRISMLRLGHNVASGDGRNGGRVRAFRLHPHPVAAFGAA